ncbi:unnamed protein product, partial [Closterium sp. NIES-54]
MLSLFLPSLLGVLLALLASPHAGQPGAGATQHRRACHRRPHQGNPPTHFPALLSVIFLRSPPSLSHFPPAWCRATSTCMPSQVLSRSAQPTLPPLCSVSPPPLIPHPPSLLSPLTPPLSSHPSLPPLPPSISHPHPIFPSSPLPHPLGFPLNAPTPPFPPLKLMQAWFRELPEGLLDRLKPEKVAAAEREEQMLPLIATLPALPDLYPHPRTLPLNAGVVPRVTRGSTGPAEARE